jgi:hypothetical protein
LIGFTPIDEQVKISQEVRVMFKYFFIVRRIEFGMVAAAIQAKVDCVDYISHLIPFKLTPDGSQRQSLRAGSLIQ